MKFTTGDGVDVNWPFQIAEVNKVLASVSFMVDTGHRVVFDQDEETGQDISFILNKKTGTCVKMCRGRQVWVIDACVDEDIEPGFTRQD